MPANDFQGSFGRSLLSVRRDQVDSTLAGSSYHELDSFQRQVAEKFIDLNAAGGENELLSLEWIGKLLDSFLCCQEEFRSIVFNHRSQIFKSPTDHLISDYFELNIKALDVCNAIRDGIEQIRQWQKLTDIIISALNSHRPIGEGQLRRSKKSLIDLAITMLDEKDPSSGTNLAHRNRSFGRTKDNNNTNHNRSIGHFRSLSWSVSRSWSASKQYQALANNLTTPRPNDVVATSGLAIPVYTMTSVLLFVMWVLVAAIPCQDRGISSCLDIFNGQHRLCRCTTRLSRNQREEIGRIVVDCLKRLIKLRKVLRLMNELIDSIHFPLTDQKEIELKQTVEELVQVHEALKNGLDPFERKVREVFHRIVRSRTECLDSL